MAKTVVIGSGFSGLAAACYLAKAGHRVTVLEKNGSAGGRARVLEAGGFLFDMGPSWYWMPDIFESFFQAFEHSASDYYQLVKLDPGFQVFFGGGQPVQIPAGREELYTLFESIEKGSAEKLRRFLAEGEFKYRIGMQQLAYKPAHSWLEFANLQVMAGALRSHLFTPMRSYVRRFFKDERLATIMEFPVLFLGARPQNIPALYSLMNYAALEQGTFYPMGGMYRIVDAMTGLARSLGVEILTGCEAQGISVQNKRATGVSTGNGFYAADAVIASGDYHHTEQKLLEEAHRNYPARYWDKKTFAPSCLIFYLGIGKKIKGLQHHNLFFDRDFEKHSAQIYDKPEWPAEPLFYVCCPSKTDPAVAPPGMENLFILIPLAPGLHDPETLRQDTLKKVLKRLELECSDSIADHIMYEKSYCVSDFVNDYHAYKGNAYGLANTLRQTAVLKPSVRNRHVKNLFYAGQLTVPGPGVPPALISGKIAAGEALQLLKTIHHETTV